MPKALCITGLSVSAVLFIIFLWDLVTPSWMAPFRKANISIDIAFVLCSVALAYMSWTTWKEQMK